MKWCIDFPEETILVVRPCLKRICLDNKPAAKLLSVLLYRFSIRKEAAEDAENLNEVKVSEGRKADQDTSFRIYRKQAQLVADMVDEIDEKTLHNVAIPLLQLLGYLDIEERPGMNCYTVHLDRVNAAMSAYRQGMKALEAFLMELPQLEKVLIGVRLEKFLINKKNFLSELEKVLIANRNNSHCKRGRKVSSQAVRVAQNGESQIITKIITKITSNKTDSLVADATTHTPDVDADTSLDTPHADETPGCAVSPALTPTQRIGTAASASETGANNGHTDNMVHSHSGNSGSTRADSRGGISDPHTGDNRLHGLRVGNGGTRQTTQEQEQVIQPTPSFSPSLLVDAEKSTDIAPVRTSQASGRRSTKPARTAPVTLPASEPDMSGSWSNETIVQYAEWCNGRVYTGKMRDAQLAAAEKLHKDDRNLTMQQYKLAHDERYDSWWREHKRVLHVTDMKAREPSSQVVRVYAMLDRIETRGMQQVQRATLSAALAQPVQRDLVPPPPKSREQLRADQEKYRRHA